jgi:type IV fimbrial biogenesis protein FimT
MHMHSQRGMSLIEVMVAITVAALLLALGLPSFSTGMQNRQIRTAAGAIQNGLQIARTEALRRNRNVQFTLRDQSGYTVSCADNIGPDGQPICPEPLQKREASEGSSANAQTTVVQWSDASNSAAGSPVFTGNLKFTPLGRVTDDSLPAGNRAIYQVTNPAGGNCAAAGGEMRCLTVVVTKFGQIRTCDPAVSASSDPRHC